MPLRTHQEEFSQTIDGIIAGSKIKTVLCYVTPGGGKSSLPVIAGKLITAGKADALCWVVPRKELQNQGETVFMDPFFKSMFNVNLSIRSSTNEYDPCRGLNGFITTYNAIGTDKTRSVESEFFRKRYILVLDEYHHLEKGGVWEKALMSIVKKAEYIILLTGTLGRGDGSEISFTKYDRHGSPILDDSEDTKVIQYSRTLALSEQAILPIHFEFVDGKLAWRDKDENYVDITSFRRASLKENSAAIYTALHTDYAKQLLSKSVNHWLNHRTKNPNSKLLVVTDGIENARKHVATLKNSGIHAEIATSHDSATAQRNIRWFKKDLPALVTIAMAYEGMDVPAVTHLCCLTHIRSTEWIEQMLARAVRVDKNAGPYESQMAYVFAPTDKKFMSVVDRIKTEQLAQTKKKLFEQKSEKPMAQDLPGFAGKKQVVTPISGSVHGTEAIIPKKTFIPAIETPKDRELSYRKKISRHINAYCAMNRIKEEAFNSEIKLRIGKPRALMNMAELEQLWAILMDQYPLSIVRGTGRLPVSKKVTPVYPQTHGSYGFESF